MEHLSKKQKEQELKYMEKKSVKRRIFDYFIITVAALLYGAALSLFLAPNMLAPGGVSGISIILNRVIPRVPTGTWIFLLNIPILILGAWKFGIKFILSTIYCTVLTSYFTNLLEPIGALTQDPLLAAIAGSSLIALSLGSVFKAGSTTGGMDIIIKVVRLRLPHLKTGFLYLVEDVIIIAVSALVFQNIDRALYAGLCALVTSFLLDLVLYGRDGAKLIFIISNHSDTIARRILEELDVGVTFLQGAGAYSGRDKKVILCIIKKPLSPKVEEIVKEEDPVAFMIFSSATEIYGEGYKNIFGEKL